MTITTRIRNSLAIGAAALVLGTGLAAGTAGATTLSCAVAGKGNSGATFTLLTASAAECHSGNDTNQIDAGFSLFGKTGWVLADKNDDATSGDGAAIFGLSPVNGHKYGAWSVRAGSMVQDVAITLKAGNGFGAFLLYDALKAGLWASSKELSHASLYYTPTAQPTPAPVPLPAAAWLLLAGMGGLGVVARRRKTPAA